MTVPLWAWAVTLAAFAVLVTADLMLTRSAGGLRAAAVASASWIAVALAFGVVMWLWRGPDLAGQYFAGYLLEKALSIDNVFVFVLLFASLEVPPELQRRVLYLGVAGALVLRGGFIAAGGELLEHVSWIFYVFGVLVLVAGVRMLRPGHGPGAPGRLITRGLRRVLPVSEDFAGDRFVVRSGGRLVATPLLVALIAIEATDLMFALDSIPAVFGVTDDLFVVFTSNAFALLGLRALYFLLGGAVDRFAYLKQGIAALLMFIGAKMLLDPLVHIPVTVSLAVIAAVVAAAIVASRWRERRHGQSGAQARSRDGRSRDRSEAGAR